MNEEDVNAIAEIISIRNNNLSGNFVIAKKSYEKRYAKQSYEGSVLHKTYGAVVGNILNEHKKSIAIKLAEYFKTTDDVERGCNACGQTNQPFNKERFFKIVGVEE